jgi:hypothetical protein
MREANQRLRGDGGSIMMIIKPRHVLLALAALLAPAFAVTGSPAAAATALPAAVSFCGAPVMFGLHGMGEGPSGTVSSLSPEISDFDDAQNLISGAVLIVFVPYPTVNPSGWDVLDTINKGPLTAAVQTGVSHLQSDVAAAAKDCPVSKDKIGLVGYSMGAWVINEWLEEHQSEWPVIKAVVLFGDPCWSYNYGRGLARLYTGTCSANYPYLHNKTWTTCLNRDPICGLGFAASVSPDLAHLQLIAALGCTGSSCPHHQYTNGAPSSGPIMDGARYLVRHLLG